jgi:hypothetical protein
VREEAGRTEGIEFAFSGAPEPEVFPPLFDIAAGPRDRPAAAEG